jgi:hypothetical protein
MELEEYAEQLHMEVVAAADTDPDLGLHPEVFTEVVGERLSDAGEIDALAVAYHRGRGVELGGWFLDDEGDTIHLVVTDYRGSGVESLAPKQISEAFKRLTTFVEKSLDGYSGVLDETTPAFEAAEVIRTQWKSLRAARLYLFSDAHARRPETAGGEIGGVKVSHHVWDIERLFRLDTSGLGHEPITVDVLDRTGSSIPCIQGPGAPDHRVYLLLFPATLLADLYNEYASRLLERNVRSFLQARGAVNKGIRQTILNEPDRFLAYNNGISATCSSLDLDSSVPGTVAIRAINDLQIVNGGQTTASLASAAKNDGANMARISVQAKLTVVSDDSIDELVAHISQYSNTQNKVTGADFSANDPFHIRLEELSRTTWAPAEDGSQRQTHWFFERARGQYADEQARARTLAKRKQFKALNPPQQKFTKTDLAKFEHTWEQLPHLVSLGAEKNFKEFMLRLEERRITPDAGYFERLVAKAILSRTTEKLVSAFNFGGYRANIVTYAIAKFNHHTASRLDLASVWRSQAISTPTQEALNTIIPEVFEVVTHPSGRVRHIGEWCKKMDCWAQVQEIPWSVPASLKRDLVVLRGDGSDPSPDLGLATPTAAEEDAVMEAAAVPADFWFGVSNWAKETSNLQPWQRSLAYSLGKLAANGKPPSLKQSVQGLKIKAKARELGYE